MMPNYLEQRGQRFRIHPGDVGTEAFNDEYVEALKASHAELLAACTKMGPSDFPGERRYVWHKISAAIAKAEVITKGT